jgi:KUP system potassium uptake protein
VLTAVNATFFIASCLKFVEGGFVPLSVGAALFAVMTTWRWGRKATFAAYSAKPTMTMAELVALHRTCKVFMERNAIIMAPNLRSACPVIARPRCCKCYGSGTAFWREI